MKNIELIADTKQIAYCGLYCGACPKFLKGKCPGCIKNEKASWCKVRKCCMQKNIASCADCDEFENAKECKLHNNFMAKLFALIFKSDRYACLELINENGYENFAKFMAENKLVTIKKTKR
jgi:deoxyhypusine synthase